MGKTTVRLLLVQVFLLITVFLGGAAIDKKLTAEQAMKNITWFHHDSFMIELAGKTVYIDPFKINSSKPADFILVTHEHYDHCSPEDIKKIMKKDTVIICPVQAAEKLKGFNVKVIKSPESVMAGEIKIEAVPAYNTNKPFHPKKDGKVGYILNYGGVRIYHMGDTDFTEEMKNSGKISIALVPVSGTYVMNAKEAAEAVDAIKPEIAVPMHYGLIVGNKNDGEDFKKNVKNKAIKVIVLKEGASYAE